MGISKNVIENAVAVLIILFLIAAGFFIFAEKPDIEIHEETTIDFEVNVIVRNTGNAPALDVPLRLALPQDRPPSQYVKKIEFSEEPERRTEDSEDNKFIHYTISRLEPQSEKNFTLNISLRLISVDFNIQKSKTGELENKDLKRYLLESPYINVNDTDIQNEARIIAGKSTNPAGIAHNTYEWVIENISYQQIPGEADAARTLKVREGGSAEFSNLFAALMRANGIPARRISGWGHRFEKDEELFQQRFSHGWAEFYIPDFGWVPADPAFGRTSRFEYFAKTDARHVIMTAGAGIHFLERGSFEAPEGETEINTDYKIKVKDIKTENLSLKRDLVVTGIFTIPVLFALFLVYKKLSQRRVRV